jgi:hypothetical protein
MKASTKAIRFLESLAIPEGPKAGEKIKLAPFQKKFVKGALADGVQVAVLSIGRGNAKTAPYIPLLLRGYALALRGDARSKKSRKEDDGWKYSERQFPQQSDSKL